MNVALLNPDHRRSQVRRASEEPVAHPYAANRGESVAMADERMAGIQHGTSMRQPFRPVINRSESTISGHPMAIAITNAKAESG